MKDQFTEQLEAYSRWKTTVSEQIEKYRLWLEQHEMSNPEDDLRLFEAIEALKTDQITIAVAAEFSRGKTELLNAIFFSGYERRLLPSSAGRTTMSPTELFFDAKAAHPYIRMLPIETRLDPMSITEHKNNPDNWTSVQLDVDSPENMVEAFQEIIRTKTVSREKAVRLGLFTEKTDMKMPEIVEIPMWRHVMISFPHPLLKQGLVLLDTPGLNAMGSEPELTMDMLPNAQAVICVLSADTGATKSDMDIWEASGKVYKDQQKTGVLVVLNKIDTLWDELHDEKTVQGNIERQQRATAKILGIDANDVYPVSAQKGLLAKVKKDDALLQRSGLPRLERTLSEDILPARRNIVRENIVGKIGKMVKSTESLLKDRYRALEQQVEELRNMSGKSADVLMETMKKLRAEQAVYQKDVENFQTSRHVLKRQFTALRESLALDSLDSMIGNTREDMVDSWTTPGMKKSMRVFFERVQEIMVQINWQVEKANKLVVSIYDRFREEHGFTDIKPELFATGKYVHELKLLHSKADAYRKSPVMTMSEQSFVVKRFFVSMVSHARNVFFKCNEDTEKWSKNAMAPLGKQIKERKSQLEKRLNTLQKVKQSREQMNETMAELEAEKKALAAQLHTISSILKSIQGESETPQEPKVAAG